MLTQNLHLNILVTGADGQLGREIRDLADRYPDYRFIFTTSATLDITDKKSIDAAFEEQQIHYCINCAAYTAVDKAETDTERAYAVNADGVDNLASVCAAHRTKLFHISTDYVYDGSSRQPLRENDAVAPLNVYGLSKLRGEFLVLKRDPTTIIIRTSWVYSAHGSNFVKTMIRLFNERESVSVVNDQIGSPTYAADLAKVIVDMIGQIEAGNELTGIFNYANDGVISWYQFALAIKEMTGSSCELMEVPGIVYKTPAVRPPYSVLDTSKIKQQAKVSIPFWKESLKRCLAALQQ